VLTERLWQHRRPAPHWQPVTGKVERCWRGADTGRAFWWEMCCICNTHRDWANVVCCMLYVVCVAHTENVVCVAHTESVVCVAHTQRVSYVWHTHRECLMCGTQRMLYVWHTHSVLCVAHIEKVVCVAHTENVVCVACIDWAVRDWLGQARDGSVWNVLNLEITGGLRTRLQVYKVKLQMEVKS